MVAFCRDAVAVSEATALFSLIFSWRRSAETPLRDQIFNLRLSAESRYVPAMQPAPLTPRSSGATWRDSHVARGLFRPL